MNRALLRFPRLAASAAYGCPSSTLRTTPPIHQRLVRHLSTAPPTDPKAVSSASLNASPSVPPLQTPQVTEVVPPTEVAAQVGDAVPTEALTNTAETAAVITDAAASLSDWWLQPALTLINFTHDSTGLPWYLAIAASTVAVRTLLLPATLFTMRNSARMQAIQPDIAHRREAVLEAAKAGNQQVARERQNEMQSFMKNAGVSPFKVFVGPLVQFPVFISFFVGIRRLSQANPDFTTGGIAWFTDLSVMDPTYALPLICGASLLGMTELGGDTGAKMTPQMRTGMRAVAALSVPMTYWFPTAVFCYWIPNNMFSVSLSLALRSKILRNSLGLKVDASEISGTKANKELERKMAALGKASGIARDVDVSAAVASYARSVAPGEQAVSVKPVLLKQRPKKTKRKASSS